VGDEVTRQEVRNDSLDSLRQESKRRKLQDELCQFPSLSNFEFIKNSHLINAAKRLFQFEQPAGVPFHYLYQSKGDPATVEMEDNEPAHSSGQAI